MLNERIKKRLSETRMTKTELSEKLGIEYSTLWRRLNGERKIDVEFLMQIAKVLGTTTTYLMGETDEPTPQETGEQQISTKQLLQALASLVAKNEDINGEEKANWEVTPFLGYDPNDDLDLGYWGSVVEKAKRAARSGDSGKKKIIAEMLKMAAEAIASEAPTQIAENSRTAIHANVVANRGGVKQNFK